MTQLSWSKSYCEWNYTIHKTGNFIKVFYKLKSLFFSLTYTYGIVYNKVLQKISVYLQFLYSDHYAEEKSCDVDEYSRTVLR